MVDALASGASGGNPVEVQVLSWAPNKLALVEGPGPPLTAAYHFERTGLIRQYRHAQISCTKSTSHAAWIVYTHCKAEASNRLMSIEYQAELKGQYAQLTCRGTFGKRALLSVLDQALEYAASNGLQAVLVDISDVEGAPNANERFEVGAQFAEMQLSRETIVAIAVYGREPMIDPERFAETVALNRCAVGKVFTDIDEAISWLEHTSG